MTSSPGTLDAGFVIKLNEVYHDLENQAYASKHPDIMEDEIPRWQRRGLEVLTLPRETYHILDFGSGTGFVPLQFKEWLQPYDHLTCSDLSTAMLEVCKANLVKEGLVCKLNFLKLDGKVIDLPDQSQDLITINAVMHHLPNPAELCLEVDRVLKPGGRVLIGHEPMRNTNAQSWLAWNYKLLLPIADPKQFCYEIILRLGLFEKLRRPLATFIPELEQHNKLLEKVNHRLISEGLIEKPLPATTLSSLLDIQSPTAGGSHLGRGFSRQDFLEFFPGYSLVNWETYNHLNKMHVKGPWLKKYAAWLARRYPENGTSLFCSLQKPKK